MSKNTYEKPALLCIDLQNLSISKEHCQFEKSLNIDTQKQHLTYYLNRVENVIKKNVMQLQATFRQHQFEVIHSRIQSLTQDGRDRSGEHKRLNLHVPPSSSLAEFLAGVEPVKDEIIINKTASGIFTSTNLHYVLTNLGITHLFVVGVYTNECVSSAVRSAADLGYQVTLVSDATAAINSELHNATLLTTQDRYAKVYKTVEVIQQIEQSDKKAFSHI